MSTLPGSPRPVVPKPDSSVVLPLPPPRVVPGDTADVPETFRETEKQVKGNDFFKALYLETSLEISPRTQVCPAAFAQFGN